MEAIA